MCEKLKSRKLPNSIGGEHEYYGAKMGILHLYPEDVEKMRTMSEEEKLEFKAKLLEQKRYYKD